jgi:integrase
VLLDFAVAGRRAEIAGLLVLDVADDPNGLLVDIRASKTSPRVVAVPYGSNPATCPVRAWQAWKHAASLVVRPTGPAFRRIDRHGRLLDAGLSGAAVGAVLTRAAARAGVEGRLTGHSARAGLATEARRAGKDRKAIAAITGHKENSPSLNDYIRRADQWDADENALIGIGL